MIKTIGRPNTVKTKESLFKHWISPYLKNDGSNLDAVVAMWERNLQPNSIKSLLYIAKEHIKGVELPIKPHIARVMRSKQQTPIRIPSKQEIRELRRTCKAEDPELYLPFMLSLQTGARRGEVWGLTWDNIDVLKNTILICRSYDGPTKSGKSRIVPISYELENILMAHIPINAYKSSQKVVSTKFDPNPRLRHICSLIGIKGITFHTLRHIFASLALEAGKSPKLVSQMLGHNSVTTTLDLYWSVTQETLNLDFLSDV